MIHNRTGYLRGCRCADCRAASSAYMKAYRARRPEAQVKEFRNCKVCGNRFGASYSNANKGMALYCSVTCAGEARRKPVDLRTARRLLTAKDHPLAGKRGRVLAYRAQLYDKIGPGSHPCHWCNRPVAWAVRKGAGVGAKELIVDHLDGNRRNDDLANLVPACNLCNVLRAYIRNWQDKTGLSVERLLSA